ncbi:hypothetical protein GGQ76_002997 [Aureimonas jatrophae]|nr:hypothetical protein [Aureimonas jatrophae]
MLASDPERCTHRYVHLKDLGQLVAREFEPAGGVAKEFNTIAVDDGIAMGHDGMLYSLPSREIIADSVEYMVNAHCADAMVCISNCDKITPGMLMAALRLNIGDVLRTRHRRDLSVADWEDAEMSRLGYVLRTAVLDGIDGRMRTEARLAWPRRRPKGG